MRKDAVWQPPSPPAPLPGGEGRDELRGALLRNARRSPLGQLLASAFLKKGTGSERPVRISEKFTTLRGACPLFQRAARSTSRLRLLAPAVATLTSSLASLVRLAAEVVRTRGVLDIHSRAPRRSPSQTSRGPLRPRAALDTCPRRATIGRRSGCRSPRRRPANRDLPDRAGLIGRPADAGPRFRRPLYSAPAGNRD
jgi:hypothetical protein